MKMKFIQTRSNRKKQKSNEKGQAFLMVLILLLVGTLIITSSLAFIAASIKTNGPYIKNTNDLYAAEAGVQDGEYNILNQNDTGLSGMFNSSLNSSYGNPASYNEYDFADSWSYTLPNQANNTIAAQVNNDTVKVNISNVWVPYGISAPNQTDATNIINNTNLVVSGEVTTAAAGSSTKAAVGVYTLNISYTDSTPTSTPLYIKTIGVWLPQGFTYVTGSSNIKTLYSEEQTVRDANNEAVIWTFPSTPYSSLGPTGTAPNYTAHITFSYSTSLSSVPNAMGWIVVTPNAQFPNYSYTWDADIKDYSIISTAGKTTVQAFVPTASIRDAGTAINGDYVAVGNSLMFMGNGDTPTNPGTDFDGIRYVSTVYPNYTTAQVSTIPTGSSIEGAYLYWTGYFPSSTSEPLNSSYGEEIDFFINSQQITSATGNSYISPTRTPQTDTDPTVGGYSYSCYADVTALVKTALNNGTGNATYGAGPAKNCSLGYNGDQTEGVAQQGCYAGWSIVVIYSNSQTFGHQLYLYDTFGNAQGEGGGSDIDPTDPNNPNNLGGSVSGFIVPPQDPGTQDTNASGANYDPAAVLTAFVGEGDWCYAGDSIAFNAPQPSSLSNAFNIATKYLLWDGVTLSKTTQGSPEEPNNYAAPDNVWNSSSQTGSTTVWTPSGSLNITLPLVVSSADGVDIKTFVITWESGLLQPAATSARIDLPTQYDQFNLVYIIMSFRSTVTSGGAVSYLITNN